MTKTFKGEFWKPCPGTGGGYLCCGYQILTPAQGCSMECRYCVLQAYLDGPSIVRFENYGDLEREIAAKMPGWKGVVRFGTGELADSLHDEDRSGIAKRVAATLEPYRNAVIEFKTKSVNIDSLQGINRPHRVIIAFSLNTPAMIARYETRTAPLEKRLEAAAKCESMGFHVAFHFDPMFRYEGWEREYRWVVSKIYAHLKDPARIAWISLGGFRANPALKRHLRRTNRHLPLFGGEMILGVDGKLRYPRPYRIDLYRAMQEEFMQCDREAPLYLCMESREVWEAAGMAWRIPNGLPAYLDERAKKILGIQE